MAKHNEQDLKDAVLAELYNQIHGGDEPPSASLIAQAINFLKVFPPDGEPSAVTATNQSELLRKYSNKVAQLKPKQD